VGILVLFFNIRLPDILIPWFECSVALLLIGLGIHLLWKIRHGAVLHSHVHYHHQHLHVHPHIHESTSEHRHEELSHHDVKVTKKPLFIGVMHGLAGSASLMLMILSSIPSRIIGVLYIVIFGIGSIAGMALISTMISIPFSLAHTHSTLLKAIQVCAAVMSILVGILLTSQIAFAVITVK